jgi:DNA polymerase III epsilon subunit-like protein
MNIAILDCEASSLGRDGYPIEVAWSFVQLDGLDAAGGPIEQVLIRPLPFWTDWDPQAEAVHGISRAMLAAEGEHAAVAARRISEAIDGALVYTDAPSFDGRWLRRLMQDTNVEAVFGVAPIESLFLDVSRGHFVASDSRDVMLLDRRQEYWIQRIVERAKTTHPRTHRAAADVRHYLEILRLLRAGPR